jgi:hypothetical protein
MHKAAHDLRGFFFQTRPLLISNLATGGQNRPVPSALNADSEEKHEPASDIDTAVVDSLKGSG